VFHHEVARIRQDVSMGATPSPFRQLPVPVGFRCLQLGSDPVEFSTQTLRVLHDGFVITSPRKLRTGDILSLRLRMPPENPQDRFWELRRTARVTAEQPRENGRFVYRVEYEPDLLPA
jgi:hypothetical protein